MSHTIGPWFSDHTPTADDMAHAIVENPTWIAVEAEQGHVAYCHPDNAELIAAAPEMLDALYAALPYVEEGEEFNHPDKRNLSKTIRALIAKAEAQP